jgi:hypothetical protein
MKKGINFCKMIGVDVNAINITENREHPNTKKIGVPSAPAEICTPTLEAKKLHKNLVSFSDTSLPLH